MKISIITISFNSEKTIEKTIRSVLDQNYQNYEFIIIDGESTDKTINIIKKYKKYIKLVISEKDEGIYDAINKGIKNSTGDVVSLLHSDNVFCDKACTQKVISHFKKNLKLDCLIGNTLITNIHNDKIIRSYNATFFRRWMLYLGYSPPHPSTFIKKKIYERFGLYNIKYLIAGDFDFFVRIFLKKKISYKKVNENYIRMKVGGKSTESIKSNYISSKEMINSLKYNKIFTNWFLIILRFPLKLIQYII
jgi:glycosyltransferase involved in cell wall biosynthesis